MQTHPSAGDGRIPILNPASFYPYFPDASIRTGKVFPWLDWDSVGAVAQGQRGIGNARSAFLAWRSRSFLTVACWLPIIVPVVFGIFDPVLDRIEQCRGGIFTIVCRKGPAALGTMDLPANESDGDLGLSLAVRTATAKKRSCHLTPFRFLNGPTSALF